MFKNKIKAHVIEYYFLNPSIKGKEMLFLPKNIVIRDCSFYIHVFPLRKTYSIIFVAT
jgi:hypothetical protein